MIRISLKFELLGLPVATASLPVARRPELTRLSEATFGKLPQRKNIDGYYFPSAIIPETGLPAPPHGYFLVERQKYPRYFLDLKTTLEDFLDAKSTKTRSTLRRKLKKFETEAGGDIDWRVYRTPAEMAAFHDIAIGLARQTYQARLYDAALPESETFYREMMSFAEQKRVAGFLLFLDGKPVAYVYAPVFGRTIVYGYLGYDADYAKLSPGTVLQLLALNWCFEQVDFDLFDFTEGEGSHKAFFSSHYEPCVDLLLLRKTSSLVLLVMLYRLSRAASRLFTAALDRIGLKARLRQLLRKSNGSLSPRRSVVRGSVHSPH